MHPGRRGDRHDVGVRRLEHLRVGRKPGYAKLVAGGSRAFRIDVADGAQFQPVNAFNRVEMVLADPAAADERDLEIALFRLGLSHRPGAFTRRIPSRASSYDDPQAGHVPTPESGSRSPHWHIQPTRRAGTPTTRPYAGTSPVTTAPAPTKLYSPSVTPQITVAFAPMELPRRTTVRRYSFRRETWLRGFTTFVNTMDGPQNTSSSSSTPS